MTDKKSSLLEATTSDSVTAELLICLKHSRAESDENAHEIDHLPIEITNKAHNGEEQTCEEGTKAKRLTLNRQLQKTRT